MVKTGLRYADAVVGEHLGTAVNFATKEAIRAYAEVTEDHDPIYWNEDAAKAAGYPGIVAPSGFCLQYTDIKVAVGQDRYVPQGSVHAKQHYELHGFICAGDCLTTTVTIGDKYEKKGRHYVDYRCEVTNQRGEVVCVSDYINILAEVE